MADALSITHVHFVGKVWCGTTSASLTDLTGHLRIPSGEWSTRYRAWAHSDPEQFFTDTFESNDIACPRTVYGYHPYKGKYGPTRFDGLTFYERKMMIHHNIAKHEPMKWSGYVDGGDMTALKLVSPHLFVFQYEKCHMHVRTECQSAQVVRGVCTKHVGVSHRELTIGTKGDVQSYVTKDIMQRIAVLNTTPAALDTRQGEEEADEQEATASPISADGQEVLEALISADEQEASARATP